MVTLSDSIVLSCSSCAPTEFQVLSSFDSRTTISVAIEHCQLCGGSRRSFYCRDCIRNGTFGRSRADPKASQNSDSRWDDSDPESYGEKIKRFTATKEEVKILSARYKEESGKLVRYNLKKCAIEELKERIKEKASALKYIRRCLSEGLVEVEMLHKMNNDALESISSKTTGSQKLSARIKVYYDRHSQMLARLERKNKEILSVRRKHIGHLIRYIFPIEAVQQKSEPDTSMKARVSLLAEARHTAYVKGRWIKGHSEWEEMYRIVQAVLPGHGDYNLCCTSELEGVDSILHSSTELPRRNELWNITAGLCYVTHLVNQVALFLCIRLPWNLPYREFCWAEMTEKQLNAAVFKLNCNIIHLCYMQNVNLETLHPRHTICNLRTLLSHPDLGRFCASTDVDSMNAIEDSLLNGSEELDLSDSVERLDVVEKEWEHVPASLPELEMPPSANTTSYFSTTGPNQPRSGTESQSTITSLASGLVTSAMTSLFRWGKSDK